MFKAGLHPYLLSGKQMMALNGCPLGSMPAEKRAGSQIAGCAPLPFQLIACPIQPGALGF